MWPSTSKKPQQGLLLSRVGPESVKGHDIPILKWRLKLIQELDRLDHLLDSTQEWDIYNVACTNCGTTRWSKARLGKLKKSDIIIQCDLCPLDDKLLN